MVSRNRAVDAVVAIGLGRFGGQVATSLQRLGHDVLGIDLSPKLVEQFSDQITHVAQADSTDSEALRQLGVPEYRRAVVGIGTAVEASVLTVMSLVEFGIEEIWAKATSMKHGKILAAVGAHHVIYPEAAMGDRVAHLIAGRLLDYIEFDDGFAIAKVLAPEEAVGLSLEESALRTRYGITVVGIKRAGEDFTYAHPETVVPPGSLLIITGTTAQVQRFAAIR